MTPHEEYQNLLNEKRSLSEKTKWTPEDETRNGQIDSRIVELRADIQRDNARVESRRSVGEHDTFLNGSDTRNSQIEHSATPGAGTPTAEQRAATQKTTHAVASLRGTLTNIKKPETAYRFGQFLRASLGGNAEARKFCKDAGIEVRTERHMENDNSRGGFLVPVEFDNEILGLRQTYGVIRRLSKVEPMTSDTKIKKRRQGGLKAFPIGEGKKIPVAAKKWGQTELKARKIGVISIFTDELSEDAIINVADDLAGEMGYAFAQYEDEAGFLGDGTSPYHGIVGIIPALRGLSPNVDTIAGIRKASGATWDAITGADVLGLMGCVHTQCFNGSPMFMCSSQFYLQVFERLIDAAGGVSRFEMVNGRPTFFYKGFAVEIVASMPNFDTGAGQMPLLFGDLKMATLFGDRRGMTLAATSEAVVDGESLFENEEHAIRATERFDFVAHEIGNADADPKKRVRGAVAGLMLAQA